MRAMCSATRGWRRNSSITRSRTWVHSHACAGQTGACERAPHLGLQPPRLLQLAAPALPVPKPATLSWRCEAQCPTAAWSATLPARPPVSATTPSAPARVTQCRNTARRASGIHVRLGRDSSFSALVYSILARRAGTARSPSACAASPAHARARSGTLLTMTRSATSTTPRLMPCQRETGIVGTPARAPAARRRPLAVR